MSILEFILTAMFGLFILEIGIHTLFIVTGLLYTLFGLISRPFRGRNG